MTPGRGQQAQAPGNPRSQFKGRQARRSLSYLGEVRPSCSNQTFTREENMFHSVYHVNVNCIQKPLAETRKIIICLLPGHLPRGSV